METAIHTLLEAPFHAELTGRDGLPCRVWRNPTKRAFATAIQSTASTDGLRGLLTATDLYVWQSSNLLHADFERETGILGVRLALRSGKILVNDETIDQPEHFPWIFFRRDVSAMTMDTRRTIVAAWLVSNDRLNRLYINGYKVDWYL